MSQYLLADGHAFGDAITMTPIVNERFYAWARVVNGMLQGRTGKWRFYTTAGSAATGPAPMWLPWRTATSDG